MAERKPEWREAGDLITANKTAVTDYCACVVLDENDKYILGANKSCGQDIFRRDE